MLRKNCSYPGDYERRGVPYLTTVGIMCVCILNADDDRHLTAMDFDDAVFSLILDIY